MNGILGYLIIALINGKRYFLLEEKGHEDYCCWDGDIREATIFPTHDSVFKKLETIIAIQSDKVTPSIALQRAASLCDSTIITIGLSVRPLTLSDLCYGKSFDIVKTDEGFLIKA